MSKSANIFLKFITNQYQSIIKDKTPSKRTKHYKEFRNINLMITSYIIHESPIKKLSDFKTIYKKLIVTKQVSTKSLLF